MVAPPARSGNGGGTLRKKTVTRGGKEYTYWESRVTVGRDPGTGKQLQRSFTGKTQKEVREKMQEAAVAVNEGTYTAPQRLTVGQWADIWQRDYTGALKPATAAIYRNNLNNHIKPTLGAVRLAGGERAKQNGGAEKQRGQFEWIFHSRCLQFYRSLEQLYPANLKGT